MANRVPDTQGAIPADVAANAGYLLARLGLRARKQFSAAIAELGIRPPHFGILCALSQGQALAQTQLCEGLGVDGGQLVGLLDELEHEGLVRRVVDPSDRRRRSVTLTPEGRRRFAKARRIAAATESRLLAALSPAERVELRRLLLRLADVPTQVVNG